MWFLISSSRTKGWLDPRSENAQSWNSVFTAPFSFSVFSPIVKFCSIILLMRFQMSPIKLLKSCYPGPWHSSCLGSLSSDSLLPMLSALMPCYHSLDITETSDYHNDWRQTRLSFLINCPLSRLTLSAPLMNCYLVLFKHFGGHNSCSTGGNGCMIRHPAAHARENCINEVIYCC